MKINFTKMQGAANDYIYINCMSGITFDPSDAAIKMSLRHFSVGADGVVLICASDTCDARMRMFNADGSEGRMCGNAIRCVGKYLYDNNICRKNHISIETLSGVKYLEMKIENEHAVGATVDMGSASFDASVIPVRTVGEMIDAPMSAAGMDVRATAVSMGNPHCVIFTDDIDTLDLEKIGTEFENHPLFPERVNTEFVRITDRVHLKMRVWERGSGETYACGTGACAVASAAVRLGICDAERPIEITLRGGTLIITVTSDYRVFMTGPATTVYEGVFEL